LGSQEAQRAPAAARGEAAWFYKPGWNSSVSRCSQDGNSANIFSIAKTLFTARRVRVHLPTSLTGSKATTDRFSLSQPGSKGNNPMSKLLKRFVNDESGATAIEYGLIAALIAMAIIAGAGLIGGELDEKFRSIAGSLEAVPTE
jgi:pilus assembly protein Flp/PilA